MTEPAPKSLVGAWKAHAPIFARGFKNVFLRVLRGIFTTPLGLGLICICLGGLVVWSSQHQILTDGLSYLDIASDASRGNLAALGNSYWSPAYPALIAAALYFLKPSAANEVPVMQLVNFLVYTLTVLAFWLFFSVWSRSNSDLEQTSGTGKGLLAVFAFGSFFWFVSALVVIPFTTPDLLVVAMVFFVAAMGFRIARPDASWKHFVGLGALLGIGFYVKAALFPLAFAFIAIRFLSLAQGSQFPRKKLLSLLAITTGTCVVVAAPLIVCMSLQQARFTTGDAGKLNYLWSVDKFAPDHVCWSGGTAPEYGNPLHPPRRLMENPTVLEFETPNAETYPLWHSPGYWYAGAKPVFSLGKQIKAIDENLAEYRSIAVHADGFILGAFVLLALGLMNNKRTQPWRMSFWLLAWPLAGCAMYAIVRMHPRYVAPFLLLLCLEIYRVLIFRVERRVAIGVCSIALLIAMIPLGVLLSGSLRATVRQLRQPKDEDYVVAAHKLQQMGLQPGDRVAVFGFAVNCFYARYDRLRVVAQILNADDFWKLSPAEAKRVEDRLASIGVKALIASEHPARTEKAGWTPVGAFRGGSLNVLLLNPTSNASELKDMTVRPLIAHTTRVDAARGAGADAALNAPGRHRQADTRQTGDE